MGTLILRQFAEAPRILFWLCLAIIVTIGWVVLWNIEQGGVLAAICTPSNSGARPFAALLVMWLAMSLAMMLPTAAPMLSTYMDIAGAAQSKDIDIVSPYTLALGYTSIWIVFSIAAAAVQSAMPPIEASYLAGAMFIVAGAYQFSPLKQACLSKCRHPMAYFFAHWTVKPSGIYWLGVSQGLFCLGCCWALMSLAFIAGLMNLIWMAGLGVLMLLEKTLSRNTPVVYGTGMGLIAAGVAMIWAG
jgi:predicted metal-binding membrane protein